MPDRYISKIQSSLTPDMLRPEYRELNENNPMYGHCYVAAEALFHLLGGIDSDWRPMCGKDDNEITHWWLRNDAGEISDPTAEQYTSLGLSPPYENGRRCGFMTGYNHPSRRARIIIAMVQDEE